MLVACYVSMLLGTRGASLLWFYWQVKELNAQKIPTRGVIRGDEKTIRSVQDF